MKNELEELRTLIATHRSSGTRMYARGLKEQIVSYVRSRRSRGETLGRISVELQMEQATLWNWLQRGRSPEPRGSFARVDVVEKPAAPQGLRVQGPGGIVLEGLAVAQVAELLRALR